MASQQTKDSHDMPQCVNKTGIKTIDKISEIPVVNTALNNVTDYYGQIKEKNALLRTSCNLAELSFRTLRFASTPITTLCKKPIESVDDYLCDKVDKIEHTYPAIIQPTDQITSAAYTHARDLYEKTNNMITQPRETLYNLKDMTVSTAATCGNKMLETCLENKYARMVTNPVLDFTEKSLDYYLPASSSIYDLTDRNTVTRIYNINKRVYSHVYDATFTQLKRLHSHLDHTVDKLQSLKRIMYEFYTKKQAQFVGAVSQNSLVIQCQAYLEKNNMSLVKLEEISKRYYKMILTDIFDTLNRYMNVVKDFPVSFNGTKLRQSIEYLRNQMNMESFHIYLSMSISYIKELNQALRTYTNKMIEVVSQSKLSNMCLQTLKNHFSKELPEKQQQSTQMPQSPMTRNVNTETSRTDLDTHATNTTPLEIYESDHQSPKKSNTSLSSQNSSPNCEKSTSTQDDGCISEDQESLNFDK